ncbi:putative UBX domain, ubiquitin interacting, UBA-like superfamily, Ubiquitin-like domain superfamily [Helianthus annuus]|uniref:UBX domain-containing protein 2/7 n=1 Tax=Helianthus annuus TaxID=4232 RepID=A0A9K3EJI0_HELAN|nr:plant UBX domain-containing protein 8 isoform X2 [Helianthus annuus]KAF5774856.1 putative UBX domain-containing protein 2/7 [Helianthus annuus]KAJ0482770.1 putative UBX domain, ubiquitin interacting, UBA-like superfamily, Ubiquitin-like domain superfamily [Helianthus annuus]KAJ0672423.1 putative UBX domain, ubiquitin interacting, UBA-like superfamily, Ubiquitin-like domain superfamily [Helianthus annuus]KAJ0850673.1 putative UBX domain-containing protein [Helianthus annuus]KAJ0859726.1 puta
MATPDQESINTFINITGASESIAIQKLTEHGGDLNEAVNAHFTEGDRTTHETSVAAPQDDFMDIEDPFPSASHRPGFPPFPLARDMNPFSLLDPNFTRSIFDSGPRVRTGEPFVSHPREVRQIPIEVKDGPSSTTESERSGHAPRIEDVTDTATEHVPETRGVVIVDEDDNDDDDSFPTSGLRPSAPQAADLPDYGIEEEMIRAAIEASKQDSQMGLGDEALPQPRQSQLEDPELAQAVSLSLKTAEQEKALRQQGSEVGPSEPRGSKSVEVEEMETLTSLNGRVEAGSSSFPDEVEEAEEQPLVRNRSRLIPSRSIDSAEDVEEVDLNLSSGLQQPPNINHPANNRSDFPSDEWGGISSMEHDEAVMLEAAIFGGIPEGSGYRVPFAPHQYMQNGLDGNLGPYPRSTPRPPSPSLTAQRLIREQQDDEYLAALQADREKELLEQSAKEAAMEEERRKEEEARIKLEEEQELERQLAGKEASLPQEPASDDENAVTLLVRMPDGSRRGRRFLRTDKLQHLFSFIDVARVFKPGTYRLVRPYPRQAFSDGESNLSLNELGLTSKQEALFLEPI